MNLRMALNNQYHASFKCANDISYTEVNIEVRTRKSPYTECFKMFHRSQHFGLFWLAVLVLLAERCVNARSSFLPFSSNRRGTTGPSSAPTSDPSAGKKSRKTKRRRKLPEQVPEDDPSCSRNDAKHAGKKKRKRKVKQSTSTTFVDTETNGPAKPKLKKAKKKSRSTEENKDLKRSYKGSSYGAMEKRKRRSSSETSREDEPVKRVFGTVESSESAHKSVKRRRKSRVSERSVSSAEPSKSRVFQGEASNKRKRSRRRTNLLREPVSAAPSSPKIETSKTEKSSKKTRRTKKHHHAAVADSVKEQDTEVSTVRTSLSEGDEGELRAPSITATEVPLEAPESIPPEASNVCEVEDDMVETEIPAAAATTIAQVEPEQDMEAVGIENDEKQPVDKLMQREEISGVADIESAGVDALTSQMEEFTAEAKAEEKVEGKPKDDSPEISTNRNEDVTEAEGEAPVTMDESSEGAVGDLTVDSVPTSVVETAELEPTDALPTEGTSNAVESVQESSVDNENARDIVAEDQGTVEDEVVSSDKAGVSTENNSVKEESIVAPESASDVSETNEESMEEYNPDLLEMVGESNEDESLEEYEPGLLDNVHQHNPSVTVVTETDSNSIQHETVDTEEGPENVNSQVDGDKIDATPEQDVVAFIEEVLQEDVRSWVNETSSDMDVSSDTLNGTRGGHQDSDIGEEENSDNEEAKDEPKDSDDTGGVDDNDDDETKESVLATGDAGEVSSLETDSKVDPDVSSNSAETTSQTEVSIPEAAKEETANTNTGIEEVAEAPLDLASLESAEDCDSDITVSVVTWNLAESSPSEKDAAFIKKFRKSGVRAGSGSDLVLISGQECENIKPRRSEGSRSREYRRLMIKMLGKQYVPIALHLLGGIQFGLFAKRSFVKEIEDISVADVTCGIGNVFHNKGAIAAFLKVKARNPLEGNKSKSLRMVFVTAHLAAHVKNSGARDSDFWRIFSELEAQAPEGFLPRRTSDQSEGTGNDSLLFNSVDRVFFCGDLNYRIDLPRELTEFTILGDDSLSAATKEVAYPELMRHDQLHNTIAGRRAFPGFAEGRIAFAPTFKFDKETGSYDTSHKQRIPAWTDRILFKPVGTRVLEYTSVPNSQHSDHRPVHGTFRVSMGGIELPQRSRPRKRKQRSRSDSQD
jgi:hypothetical protein